MTAVSGVLAGRRVLVVGASSGIGAALALAVAFAVALDHPDIDFPELKLDARTA